MNEYDVYREYVALKQHFNVPSYDYHRYGGKTSATVSSYKKRRDRYFFKKLSKEKDPFGIILSNLIYSDRWIGDIVVDEECYDNYKRWRRVTESLSHVFESEISPLDLKKEISADAGLPPILKKLYQDKISIETVTILMDVLNCQTYWNEKLKDDPLWNLVSLKLIKYKTFLKYDRKKMLALVKKRLTSSNSEV